MGLTRSEHDHAVFYRHHPDGYFSALLNHVDNMTLVVPDMSRMNRLKKGIGSEVEVVDSGEIHWMLGIAAKRDRENQTIALSQQTYIEQILARYGFEDLRILSTPLDPHVVFTKDQCATTVEDINFMRNKPYREALGALMYASVSTRPDITYAVSQLARFSENPGITHWTALKRVYAYLKGTKDWGLILGNTDTKHPVGYSDADGMSNEDRHAISGYAFLIGGAVSWSSKRQDIVSLSTTEAEYVALTHASKEALWMRNFLVEVAGYSTTPITINCDNLGAIALAKDDRFHSRTKHIDIRYHFIRYAIEQKKIILTYCPTEDMTADILTKSLSNMKVKHFASLLGLRKA